LRNLHQEHDFRDIACQMRGILENTVERPEYPIAWDLHTRAPKFTIMSAALTRWQARNAGNATAADTAISERDNMATIQAEQTIMDAHSSAEGEAQARQIRWTRNLQACDGRALMVHRGAVTNSRGDVQTNVMAAEQSAASLSGHTTHLQWCWRQLYASTLTVASYTAAPTRPHEKVEPPQRPPHQLLGYIGM
jgi:hypothetical protein